MTLAPTIQRVSRRDPVVRKVARAWRELTGGLSRGRDSQRRTLVAVSGGADSCGLLIALASAVSEPSRLLVVAHIVHDMRPDAETHADRDSVRRLAERLGLEFAEARVQVREARENTEAAARRLRYGALARLAAHHGCGYIATAHQADDQLETMLMKLIRGAGPRGLAGVAPSRDLAKGGPKLIRPALAVTRAGFEEVCRAAGWEWREDRTNLDTTRTRAAIRKHVLPRLRELRPHAAVRAARSAALQADASALAESSARELLDLGQKGEKHERFQWPRDLLRSQTGLVLGPMLQTAARQLAAGLHGKAFGSRTLDPVVEAIRSDSTVPRRLRLGRCRVDINSKHVDLRGPERE